MWGALLLVAGIYGGLGIAHADVPNAGHIAACNRAAHEEIRSGAATPTSKDEAGADARAEGEHHHGGAPGRARGRDAVGGPADPGDGRRGREERRVPSGLSRLHAAERVLVSSLKQPVGC